MIPFLIVQFTNNHTNNIFVYPDICIYVLNKNLFKFIIIYYIRLLFYSLFPLNIIYIYICEYISYCYNCISFFMLVFGKIKLFFIQLFRTVFDNILLNNFHKVSVKAIER